MQSINTQASAGIPEVTPKAITERVIAAPTPEDMRDIARAARLVGIPVDWVAVIASTDDDQRVQVASEFASMLPPSVLLRVFNFIIDGKPGWAPMVDKLINIIDFTQEVPEDLLTRAVFLGYYSLVTKIGAKHKNTKPMIVACLKGDSTMVSNLLGTGQVVTNEVCIAAVAGGCRYIVSTITQQYTLPIATLNYMLQCAKNMGASKHMIREIKSAINLKYAQQSRGFAKKYMLDETITFEMLTGIDAPRDFTGSYIVSKK